MYKPTVEDLEALELLGQRDDLTQWEEGFLESLEAREDWTENQHRALDDLFERKMKAGGMIR
jgi:hypothetical protein